VSISEVFFDNLDLITWRSGEVNGVLALKGALITDVTDEQQRSATLLHYGSMKEKMCLADDLIVDTTAKTSIRGHNDEELTQGSRGSHRLSGASQVFSRPDAN